MQLRRIIIYLFSVIFILIITADNPNAQQKDWPKEVSIAGSNIASAHYTYAAGFAKVLSEKLKIQATVEVTPGAAANIQLANAKQTDFSPSPMSAAYDGYHGLGWAKGKKFDNIRAVFPMYPAYLHWWVFAKDPIHSIHDFTGRSVALSGAGSVPDLSGKILFQMYNIKPSKIINAGFEDGNSLMKDGLLHASASFGGIPHPAAVEMATSFAMRIIGVEKKDADKFIEKYPHFSIGIIPANTYTGQTRAVETLVGWNTMFTNKNTPDDFVYAVVKAAFENIKTIMAAQISAKDTLIENAKFITALPFHPGAIRFYKEKGISFPESAYPPEYKK